jgi:hypothetical protein
MDRTRLIRSVTAVFAAVVIVAGCSAGPGVTTTPPPAATPAPPSATADPSPSPAASTPPAPLLNETFTSTLHGISLSYPEGWTAQAATEPWTGEVLIFRVPPADYLYDPTLTDHLFMAIASQPIGESTPDEWVAEKMSLEGDCPETAAIAVDGASGRIGAGDCSVAAVTSDGRGYLFWLYTSGDEAWLSVTYDRTWFMDVLATVDLHPEDAVGVTPWRHPGDGLIRA